MSKHIDKENDGHGLPQASDDVDSANANITASEKKGLLFRIQRFGNRKLPSLFPDPMLKEFLRLERAEDDEENAKTRPPTDEIVDVQCFWGVEFYTPSHTASLIRSIEKLDWETELSGLHSSPSTWIQRRRESLLGRGWLNLGILRRPDTRRSRIGSRPTPLPLGIDYAIGGMYSLTSSITCVIICFVLDETLNKQYLGALNQDRQTQRKPLRRGAYQIHDPELQKAAHVHAIRAELREKVFQWFRAHLPGLFSTGQDPAAQPTCEFLTLRKTDPFSANSKAVTGIGKSPLNGNLSCPVSKSCDRSVSAGTGGEHAHSRGLLDDQRATRARAVSQGHC